MHQPNAKRHVCDCGQEYPTVNDLHHCASRNHGRLNRNQLCGAAFGPELLLWGMEPGQGLRRMCMLFQNHEGRCSDSNPELEEFYRDYENYLDANEGALVRITKGPSAGSR